MTQMPDWLWIVETIPPSETRTHDMRPKKPNVKGAPVYKYVRDDLASWRPISELEMTERVILLYDNGHIDSGWLDCLNGRKIIRTGHGKQNLNRFTHFMVCPEIPK